MSQKKYLFNFIHALMEHKYADAQGYLNLAVESKIKDRIKNAKDKDADKKDSVKKDAPKKVSKDATKKASIEKKDSSKKGK